MKYMNKWNYKEEKMKIILNRKNLFQILSLVLFLTLFIQTNTAFAQFETKWMSVGSLHNWYSAIGSEIEHGLRPIQQYGLRWPAIYDLQDMQAAKAIWIGSTNFTDQNGEIFPHKVVHVGPRVTGAFEFFPVRFEMISKFDPPIVSVDGNLSELTPVDNNAVDETMKADRMIVNVANTQLGITMTRKIMQFSNQYHDNYHLFEYTFKNTGNVDGDADIELPSTTLTGVYFYFLNRYAVCRNTRYEIGNGTGWGMNTMIDARGDGNNPSKYGDPADENFRTQFVWHGNFPPFVAYDNIGGPLWTKAVDVAVSDTVGRLGAPQFTGWLTLHADVSATDKNNDPTQPKTVSYEGSDEPNTSQNDPYNLQKMTSEYGWMSEGINENRHAWVVEPDGDFATATGDPALGTPGGHSAAFGYGPYTLAPGDSITLILAEGSAGISWEKAIEWGREYKQEFLAAGTNTALQDAATLKKNQRVLTGKDSLMQTWRRAIANFQSGFNIVQPPLPPRLFDVTSGGDRISLSWQTYDNTSDLRGFEIWRAKDRYDSAYTKIVSLDATARSYDDITPQRGFDYYYYIVSVGDPIPADPLLNIPAGALTSSRYYTQSYDPANLLRPSDEEMDSIRIVPNPYNISASTTDGLRFSQTDRLAFYNIPGECTIKIYTELGELIHSIEHLNGSGDEYWYSNTSSNQIVVSGVYIAVIEDHKTGRRAIEKFVVIR
jgi:hypothetical protein